MDQGRCDLATLSRHGPETGPGNSEKFGWFQGNHISWRSYQAGIWQHASHIPCMPLNGFVRPGTAIHEQGQPAGKNDVKGLHRTILATEHVAGIQPPDRSVGYQPLQLGPGGTAQCSVFNQPIDQVLCYQRLSPSKLEAGDSLTRYQKENTVVLADGGGALRIAFWGGRSYQGAT